MMAPTIQVTLNGGPFDGKQQPLELPLCAMHHYFIPERIPWFWVDVDGEPVRKQMEDGPYGYYVRVTGLTYEWEPVKLPVPTEATTP